MKNYVVKALTNFDDYQGLEITPNVTKERYEHLKELNLVVLVGIDKVEEKEVKKTTKKKK